MAFGTGFRTSGRGAPTQVFNEEEARAPFQLRDIRRTCETMLAALKVSKDVRSHLLSHGLGGVQNQHYDHHTYWLEKVRAFKKWAAHLAKLKAGRSADIIPVTERQEHRRERL